MAGAEEAAELTSTGLSSLAAVNVVKVAVEFIGLIGQVSSTNDHWNYAPTYPFEMKVRGHQG